ncbi:MAG: hypothetical protein GTO54_02645, partial [Nitrososphaeria archaeon]|nr:hypothetical protein [Nitrososphaeria archaeon]NIN52001.1 hypothetical protein [Nitrososphaeria archaeon]
MSELKGKYIGLILAAILTVTLIPGLVTYAEGQDEKRASKYVELADRAAERVENFIDLIISNATANATIDAEGLMPMLEG